MNQRTQTIGDVFIDDFVILSVLQCSCMSTHRRRMPHTVSSKCPHMRARLGSTLSGENLGKSLCGVSGTLGFPLERQVSPLLIVVAAVGVTGSCSASEPCEKSPRYECISKWRWRLRGVRSHRRLARFAQFGREERRTLVP